VKDRLKVAYVMAGIDFGGIEKVLYDIAHKFRDDEDIDFRIINISGTGRKYEDMVKEGFDILTCGNDQDVLKKFNFGTVRKLRKIIKDMKPDVVHTTQYKADYFGRLACIGLDVKVLTHIRNSNIPKDFFRRFSNKLLDRFTDMYVSVSDEVKEMVDTQYNKSGRPSRVMYNFIDHEKVNKAEPTDKASLGLKDKKVIISVGRFVPVKNIGVIISAMPMILEKLPNAHYIAVGEGGLMDSLKKQVEELGLQESVTLPGYRKDVYSLLKMADIYVMPSGYEGFSNAHIEAMACGLPCVVSDKISTQALMGKSSVYCEIDENVMAENICRILSDEKLAAEMSAEAVSISDGFSVESYIAKFKALYRELCDL